MIDLYKQYRYVKEPVRVWLKAIPDTGHDAIRFYAETYKIANDLFNGGKSGAAGNSVCTAQGGGIIFQHRDAAINLKRAKMVTHIWRKWRRYHMDTCTMNFLTTSQAADLLGLEQDTVKRYILRGLIQARKIGRDWLIDPAEVERYRRTRRRPGRPRKPAQ